MKKNLYINLNDYDKDFFINKGSFGEVFLIKRKDKPDDDYEAKIYFNKITEDSKGSIDLKREINIISKISHPCIIKFIGFGPKNYEKRHKTVIVTEYLKNGSLDKLLDLSMKGIATDEWDDTLQLITLYGIDSGMAFLHANNICHRDLKTTNVLLDEYLHPKICVFGLSKENGSIVERGFQGTILYSSPEIIQEYDYTPAGDVYAYSIMAYQIIMNEMSFSLQLKIARGERPKFNSFIYISRINRKLLER